MEKTQNYEECETVRSETKLEESLGRLLNMWDEVVSVDIELHRIKSDLMGSVPEGEEKEPSQLSGGGKLGELDSSISNIDKKLRSIRESISVIQSLI